MLPAMQVSSHLYEHTVLKIKRPLSLIPHASAWFRANGSHQGSIPSLWYTAFVPLPVEVLAAIGRVLSNHS